MGTDEWSDGGLSVPMYIWTILEKDNLCLRLGLLLSLCRTTGDWRSTVGRGYIGEGA